MQRCTLLCLLLVAAVAAAPRREEPEASSDTSSSDSSSIEGIVDRTLDERPKRARQLFPSGKRKLRRRVKEARGEDDSEEAAIDRENKQKDRKAIVSRHSARDLGQEEGWSPVDRPFKRQLARSLSLSESDDPAAGSSEASNDTSSEAEDLDLEENEVEDREAENSYLSPLYAPAPGGLAGGYGGYGGSYGGGYGGYGGQGPYIYILPIVLPPPGRHHGPAARHVVTETGHESHHYSGGHAGLPPGGHGQYQPVYAGSHGVPPIYIPKGYGGVHGGRGIHGGYGGHGKHGGHTTVHHEEAAIIRDIDPPIFKA